VEFAVMAGVIAAALVAISVYLQRGYQGYLRTTSSVHGLQFDPTQPYTVNHQLNTMTQRFAVDITASGPSAKAPSGNDEDLPSAPGGTLPGGTMSIRTASSSSAEWDVIKNATFEAQ
jgi:hypothetical protein